MTQEARLRERYDTARLVISDRMHVLVLGALSGAVPVELVPHPTEKIARAFDTIGLHELTLDAATSTPDEMQRFLRAQATRSAEVRARVVAAETRIAEVEAEVRTAIERVRG